MTRPRIVTCFPLTEGQIVTLRAALGDRWELVVSSQEAIASDLGRATVFFGHAKVPVDWASVVAENRLQWIQSSAAGLDHCLVPEVIRSPIAVSGCSGLFAPQVAEQTVALLMGLIRRLPVFFRAQQTRDYVRRPTDNLEGKQVLILGMGGNGQRIARVLAPLAGALVGTDVFADSLTTGTETVAGVAIHPPERMDQLLPQADVVICTLPLSEANEGCIGDRQFEQMKPGAYFINVGRGSVVQTAALVRALDLGRIGGAGIDVVDPEPLPEDSPLWEMDHVIISPHVGAQSPHRVDRTIELFCENLQRFERSESLLNQVDKQLGFPTLEHRIRFA